MYLHEKISRHEALLRDGMAQTRPGSFDGLGCILKCQAPQRQVDLFRAAGFQRLLAGSGVIEIALEFYQQILDGLGVGRFEWQPHPRGDCPHHGAEAHQVVLDDDAQQAPESLGLGLIGGFHDHLAQPFFALCGQQQALDEVPAIRAGGAQQPAHHVPAHAPGGVVTAGGGGQDIKDLLAGRSAALDRPGEQKPQNLRPAPAQVRGPRGEPAYRLVKTPYRAEQLLYPGAAPPGVPIPRHQRPRQAERPAVVTHLVGQVVEQVPGHLQLLRQGGHQGREQAPALGGGKLAQAFQRLVRPFLRLVAAIGFVGFAHPQQPPADAVQCLRQGRQPLDLLLKVSFIVKRLKLLVCLGGQEHA